MASGSTTFIENKAGGGGGECSKSLFVFVVLYIFGVSQ